MSFATVSYVYFPALKHVLFTNAPRAFAIAQQALCVTSLRKNRLEVSVYRTEVLYL
jgi:hypothetical protein